MRLVMKLLLTLQAQLISIEAKMTIKEEIQQKFKDRLADIKWQVLNKTTSTVYSRPVAVVLMSGGVESTTLVAWYKRRRYDVVGLFMDYGQPWMTEELATVNVAKFFNVQLVRFKMDPLPGLHPITDSEYSMAFLAMRNPILISIAMNFAFAAGYSIVAHGAERSVHPDCSPEFVDRFNFMAESALGNETDIVLSTPFVELSKWQVIKQAKKLHAPMNWTWSCMINDKSVPQDFSYEVLYGESDPLLRPANCGRCPSCEWRLESYKKANLIDPASYAIDTASQQRKGARSFPYYSSAKWLKEVDRSSTRIL